MGLRLLQGERWTKEKRTAIEKAGVLPIPAQADFPSLWRNIPCSQADPLSPDNEHSGQGELLFRGFSSRIKLWGGLEKRENVGQG